jgi:uncharacterized protein YaeQ
LALSGFGPEGTWPAPAMVSPMALAPTLYEVQLQLSDPERRVDLQRTLKIARHPSETMERVWLRLLAFCWRYDERLELAGSVSDPELPDLRSDDLTGRMTQWIRVSKADPAKIRRAVTQNGGAKVSVLFESVERLESFLELAKKEEVTHLGAADLAAVDGQLLRDLGRLDQRRLKVSVTLVGDHLYLNVGDDALDGPLTRANAE